MPKKFFDIISPEKIKPDGNIIEERKDKLLNLKSGRNGRRRGFWRGKKAGASIVAKTLFFCLFFLILTGVFIFLVFSKVEIEIWPKIRTLDLKTNITVELGNIRPDFEAKIIPGKVFENQKTASKEFPASGKMMKEEKAKGIIRVFNEYSASLQGLLPNTRFVSDKGRLFRSLKREVIPGGHYEKGKFVAGFADIAVIAAESGGDYNISPSTFSIPGFKGTEKYTYFYGKSFSDMTGGFKEEVSRVVAEDIKKAELTLSNELKKESKNLLKEIIPPDYILLDETVFQDVAESNSSVEAGSEAESFNLQIKINSKGVGFKKSEIDGLVQKFIVSNISEDEKFQRESLEVNYSLESPLFPERDKTDFLKSGKITLGVKIIAKIYQDINLIKLKKALADKSLKEVKTFLGDLSQIERVKIKSWPFLRGNVPDDINKIELRLNLDPVRDLP